MATSSPTTATATAAGAPAMRSPTASTAASSNNTTSSTTTAPPSPSSSNHPLQPPPPAMMQQKISSNLRSQGHHYNDDRETKSPKPTGEASVSSFKDGGSVIIADSNHHHLRPNHHPSFVSHATSNTTTRAAGSASVTFQQPIEDEDEDPAEFMDEIYDIVDAVVPRSDDPTLPVLTFRVLVLGPLFSFTSPFIGVLIAYPIGLFMSKTLPRKTYRFLGIPFSLNPGKFNFKEHTLIFVFCNSGASPAYALYNIIGQKYQLYQDSLGLAPSIAFAVVTQIFGYGLAGLCRRYLVRPASMLWPANLSIVAMLNSLHDNSHSPSSATPPTTKSSDPSLRMSGGSAPGSLSSATPRLSRFAFFWIAVTATALYQLLPSYIAPLLASISILCYLAPYTPNEKVVRMLGSAQVGGGIGMLSLSFDWNVISSMAPITSPLWALINQVLGLWLMAWLVTPLLWVNNAFGMDQKLGADPDQGPNGTGVAYNLENDRWQLKVRFPLGQALNSPALFNRNGVAVQTRRFVFRGNLTLDEAFYDAQKPIYITTFFAIEYTASFIVFAAAISHVALWYGRDIFNRFRTSIGDLDRSDVHARLMDVYADVPDVWYITLLLANLAAAVGVCQWGGFDLPWWGVVMALALAIISVLPIGIIQAISGQQIGLNVMSEFLIGLIIPGRMAGVMAFKTLSYMSMYQGLALVSDLKLGHYMKIPPRIMFGVQLVSTVMAAVVNVFVACAIYESFGKTTWRSDPNNPDSPFSWKLQYPEEVPLGWSSTNYNVFLNAGAIWGAIGPARFFGPGSPYQWTLTGFLIGAVAPLIPWILHRAFPEGYWHLVNVPLIAAFPGSGTGALRSDMITPLLIGVLINYFIKKHRYSWWKRYAYVLSAALDSGLAICLTFVFAAFQANATYQIPFPAWAMNRFDGEHCAPEFYLVCNENRRKAEAMGGSYNQTFDPYCFEINFQGGNNEKK
ncbi:hypothetical protein HDU96_002334 [Phlyctochytrium bullatum]|nr:hypothetical protein HDU96_002334 [Phlyctochytrium bullatum]